MVQGIDEPFDSCNTLNLVTRFIKPISHLFTLVFCVYYIGHRRKLYNYLSFWFSIYQILAIIGGIFELFQCSFTYKDEQDWTLANEIVAICSTVFTTSMMSLWWIMILLCWYKKWSKQKIIKIGKIMVGIIILFIIPMQLVILFTFGYTTAMSNVLRTGGIVGQVFNIAMIFVLKSDPNVPKFTSYQLWFILVWCGVLSYFIASVTVFIYNYAWGRILIWQYFWFVAYWLLYLESLPQTKIYDWDHEWNSASKQLTQMMMIHQSDVNRNTRIEQNMISI